MTIVIDSSITLAWLLADERTAAARDVLMEVATAGALVPSLWRLEVANALLLAVRRRRIDGAYLDACLQDLAALPIALDPDTDRHAWSGTLLLARRCDLTLYDASYLELAQRTAHPLATLDTALRSAASGVGVGLLGQEGDRS